MTTSVWLSVCLSVAVCAISYLFHRAQRVLLEPSRRLDVCGLMTCHCGRWYRGLRQSTAVEDDYRVELSGETLITWNEQLTHNSVLYICMFVCVCMLCLLKSVTHSEINLKWNFVSFQPTTDNIVSVRFYHFITQDQCKMQILSCFVQ